MENERSVLSVSQLNEYIKAKIEGDTFLSSLFVRGEISNFTAHKSGHFYFSIKDEGSLIRAVMFRASAAKLPFAPANGMKVIIHGRVSLFVRDGQYQLYADSMEPDGVGALYIAYEQLKEKLSSEGLFDQDKKRPLPKYPKCVGVITSPTGAAIRDIINIVTRRFPYAKILLYPALVQGAQAAPSLIAGVEYFSSSRSADVVIIGRGGGSIEDLWAFNDEALARAVRACSVPIISAVGHETDFTICDFSADLRAPTPSAAAELAVPETNELKRKINNITDYTRNSLLKNIASYRESVKRYSLSRVLTSPESYIDDRRMALFDLARRMDSSWEHTEALRRASLREGAAKLGALDPLSVLTRGYGAVFKDDGKVITSVDCVGAGDDMVIRLRDGKIKAQVRDIEKQQEKKRKKNV